ncbi:hypothetical protein JW711_05175 [Candidatus Woesearchaeota archaeon]|nr:hypothetical protein [Candidatus Woesearchaeota archaeon]
MGSNWMNKRLKNLQWYDVSLIKLSTAAFILMIAKLWDGILSFDWYWYLVIGLVCAIPAWVDLERKK